MKVQTMFLIAVAMSGTAGIAAAQKEADSEQAQPTMAMPSNVDFTPMDGSERLRRYLTGTFGRSSLAGAALHAEISQLRRTPAEWGNDASGYGSRFGSAFARHIIRQTLEYGGSSMLHEDNRYLRSGQEGFWKRTKYAVTSSFLTRHDNGGRGLAFSRIGSAAGAAFISRAWLPPSVATAADAASSFGISIGAGVGSNVVREFWPDLKRRFGRK